MRVPERFCADNTDTSVPLQKLVVRGFVVDSRLTRTKGQVLGKLYDASPFRAWKTDGILGSTDTIIHLQGFTHTNIPWERFPIYRNQGLWVLRPVKHDEFKLVACLRGDKIGSLPPYREWHWEPEDVENIGKAAQSCRKFHRLSIPGTVIWDKEIVTAVDLL